MSDEKLEAALKQFAEIVPEEQLKQIIKEEVASLSEALHPYHPINKHIAAILKIYRMQRPEDQGSIKQAIRELLSSMERMSE